MPLENYNSVDLGSNIIDDPGISPNKKKNRESTLRNTTKARINDVAQREKEKAEV